MVGICMSLKTKILLLCLCFHAVEIPAEAAFGKVQATVSLLYAIFFSILKDKNNIPKANMKDKLQLRVE